MMSQRRKSRENEIRDELAYNNNWARLSRGLTNFPIRVQKKRPEREISFERLLHKIGSMTDKILENAISPRSKELLDKRKLACRQER